LSHFAEKHGMTNVSLPAIDAYLQRTRRQTTARPTIRQTHTHSVLRISTPAYNEIRTLLEAAGYQHAFSSDQHGPLIDMHGIAVQSKG
jgi:hypothetical protein